MPPNPDRPTYRAFLSYSHGDKAAADEWHARLETMPVDPTSRIEALAALDDSTRPAWSAAFEQRWDASYEEGRDKGFAFPLEVAAALARCMLLAAETPDERGYADNMLGIALQTIGGRESGTARLDEAVAAYRAALEERSRDRVPLDGAFSQHTLANALATLAERTHAAPAWRRPSPACATRPRFTARST
jgi:hypothetical protein